MRRSGAACCAICLRALRVARAGPTGRCCSSLCLLNILGWECADDLDRMEADEGLCRLVSRREARILGVSRRSLRRRQRKGRQRTFPSPRSLLDWLHGHEDVAAGRARTKGEAYVPVPSATLVRIQRVLERNGIRIGGILSRITHSVNGRRMIEGLVAGASR